MQHPLRGPVDARLVSPVAGGHELYPVYWHTLSQTLLVDTLCLPCHRRRLRLPGVSGPNLSARAKLERHKFAAIIKLQRKPIPTRDTRRE